MLWHLSVALMRITTTESQLHLTFHTAGEAHHEIISAGNPQHYPAHREQRGGPPPLLLLVDGGEGRLPRGEHPARKRLRRLAALEWAGFAGTRCRVRPRVDAEHRALATEAPQQREECLTTPRRHHAEDTLSAGARRGRSPRGDPRRPAAAPIALPVRLPTSLARRRRGGGARCVARWVGAGGRFAVQRVRVLRRGAEGRQRGAAGGGAGAEAAAHRDSRNGGGGGVGGRRGRGVRPRPPPAAAPVDALQRGVVRRAAVAEGGDDVAQQRDRPLRSPRAGGAPSPHPVAQQLTLRASTRMVVEWW
eukprot:gene8873-biopygen7598